MTIFESELQELKQHDEVQQTIRLKKGYDFIMTAGHGYLVVPATDDHYKTAKQLVDCGFNGRHAAYLEEDFEAGEFLKMVEV